MNLKIQIKILLVVGLLLTIPLVAMQFTDEVDWSPSDFMIMGLLLSVTGFTGILISKKVNSYSHRVFFLLISIIIFLMIWAELAVGIFGSQFAGS